MKRLAGLTGLPPRQGWLLAGLALVVAPHLGRLPVWLGAACVLALGWRALHDAGRVRLPGRVVRLLLTAALVGGVAATYHSLVGRHAGVALLLGLVCLKTLEMRSGRDGTLLVFLALFVVITGFLFSQSLLMGAYMLAAVWVLLTALIAAGHADGSGKGAAGADAARGGVLLAQAVPLAAVLFLLFPRVPGPLWGMPEDAAARTGLSDRMSPGAISRLADSDAVAFRVQFEGPPPPAAQRYWRGPVLGAFDGYTWSPLPAAGEARPQYRARGEALAYTVTLEPHRQRWLFALDLPAAVPPGGYLTDELQLLSRGPVDEVQAYAMRSHLDYAFDGNAPERLSAYLRLPRDSAPRARALARRLAAQAGTPEAVVREALAHFAGGPFRYTREPPLLPEAPVDGFLFDTQRGFCEHYAGAFVVLMRAAGIPARVVTGYLGGEMNPLGDYLIVRQSDAHAWAEVWLPDAGWTRVDPTAAIPPERIDSPLDIVRRLPEAQRRAEQARTPLIRRAWTRLRYGWDRLNHGWNHWVIGYNAGRQQSLLARLGLGEAGATARAAVLVASLAVILGALGWGLRRSAGPRDAVQVCYARFCRALARRGVPRRTGEGPLDYAARAARAQPQAAGTIRHIAALYAALRYAPAAGEQELAELRRSVRRFTCRYRSWRRSGPADPPR